MIRVNVGLLSIPGRRLFFVEKFDSLRLLILLIISEDGYVVLALSGFLSIRSTIEPFLPIPHVPLPRNISCPSIAAVISRVVSS